MSENPLPESDTQPPPLFGPTEDDVRRFLRVWARHNGCTFVALVAARPGEQPEPIASIRLNREKP